MIADALLVVAVAYGIGSAMIPVLNAEAYVAAMAATLGGADVVAMVVAVTLGTVIGKVALFCAARAGRDLARRRPARPPRPGRVRAWLRRATEALMAWLDDPLRAVVTVLVSGFLGVPPLLAVAVVAGTSRMRVVTFALAMGVGRGARFAVIAGAVHGIV